MIKIEISVLEIIKPKITGTKKLGKFLICGINFALKNV
jgi:hypothetical protein